MSWVGLSSKHTTGRFGAQGHVVHSKVDTDADRDIIVADPGVGRQQNLRPLERACGPLAAAHKRRGRAFGLVEFDPIAYIHPCLLAERHGPTAELDGPA
jgi:hypothetical protein